MATCTLIFLPLIPANAGISRHLLGDPGSRKRDRDERKRSNPPYAIPLLPGRAMTRFQTGRNQAEGLFWQRMELSEGAQAYRLFNAREDNVVKIMMNVS